MRLKTLRKERPAFEAEGTVINGSHIDISNTDAKPIRHRSNNLFALPTSLSTEPPSASISPVNQTNEMINDSRQPNVIASSCQSSNISPYQAIEAAYLEHGIRIRLSPTKVTSSGQLSERKSANSLKRRTPFINRLPSRASSVLQYSTTDQDQYRDSRPFSVLQQTSFKEFAPTENHTNDIVDSQPSQTKEEKLEHYQVPPTPALEYVNPVNSPDVFSIANGTTASTTSFNHDPDLAYMSKLLKQPSGESIRESIRRRAGLRGTFAVHRNPVIVNPVQLQQNSREKSPNMPQSSLTRHATIAVVPTSSPQKIDNDILKHVSRIRQTNQSNSPRINSAAIFSSPPRATTVSIPSSPTRLNRISTTNPSPRTNSLSITSSPLRTHTTSAVSVPSRTNSLSMASVPLRTNTIPNTNPSSRTNSLSIASSPLRINHNDNYYKRSSTNKPAKSTISLEPLAILLSSIPQPTTVFTKDLLIAKTSSTNNNTSNSIQRTKSARTLTIHDLNTTTVPIREYSTSSSLLHDESLLSTKASTLNVPRQSNSFDSGCYDRSSSGGDMQSLTSSSVVQIPSSVPSARLTNSSTTRRSHSSKKVSFYDESTAVIVTTATYV